ncbi:MAG TPA: hypothetical protein VLQ92_00440, partial [Candidatus Limnocylindrales bacterium]|nr:hypothetical protein [Candidatus Limnocylindrales bacterium]
MIVLPAGFTASPLADEDIDDVVTLVRTCELHDSGEQMFERADLVGDLVGADRAQDALVVRGTGGAVAAWGLVLRRR